jgi:hypothetical protein
LALLFVASYAHAASLSGLYIELGTSAVGTEMDGSYSDDDSDISYGQVGKTAVTGSYGIGFMTSRDRPFGLDLGWAASPGSAKLNTTSDNTGSDVSIELSDMTELYITAMANITEDASVYFKLGRSEVDTTVSSTVKDPGDFSGDTVALGTVMSWGSNMYIRTEAGITDWDNVTITGSGSGVGTDESITIDPTSHYGKIAIGFKF